MKLQGKRALVTGADSGIGQAIATLFAQKARTWRSCITPIKPVPMKPDSVEAAGK